MAEGNNENSGDNGLDTGNRARQAIYPAMSRIGEITKRIPAAMEDAVRKSNSRFLRVHPEGADAFVGKRLRMNERELEAAFSPEQIDAIAIGMDARDRNYTPIIGDQTGTGKGRILVALSLDEINHGRRAIYVTKDPVSFSDIWREIVAIGKADEFRPLVMKANDPKARIIDETDNSVIHGTMGASEIKGMNILDHWPDGRSFRVLSINTKLADALTHAKKKEGVMGKKYPTLSEKDVQWLKDYQRDRHIFLHDRQEIPDSLKEAFVAVKEEWLEKEEEFAPEGNFILTTYSQFNRRGPETEEEREKREASRSRKASVAPSADDRAAWLISRCGSDASLICDEIHVAGNIESSTGRNFNMAVNAAYEGGNGAVFASATWASNEKGLGIYKTCLPHSIRNGYEAILKAGGVAMQEVFSSALTAMGTYIRREHASDTVNFDVQFDAEHFERNRNMINMTAPIISNMAVLSGAIRDRYSHTGRRLADKRGVGSQNRLNSFTSSINSIGRALDVSMKIDHTLDMAIKAIENGEKPVILVDSTMESLMQSLIDDGISKAPDLKHMLLRSLDRLVERDAKETKDRILSLDAEESLYREIMTRFLSTVPDALFDINSRGITEDTPESAIDGIIEGNRKEATESMKTLGYEGPDALSNYFNMEIHRILEGVCDESMARTEQGIRRKHENDPEGARKKIEGARARIKSIRGSIEESLLSKNAATQDIALSSVSDHLEMMRQSIPVDPMKMVDRVRKEIAALPDMPVSAIDEIKHRLRRAGYRVDEITGRSLEVDEAGKISSRTIRPKGIIKNEFNNGTPDGLVDALIINGAAATAIDLHASARFRDQRPRHMFLLQPSDDIQKFMQSLGRVQRHDQTSAPTITTIVTGMPCEVATIASQNRKISGMSSMTSGSRDSQAMVSGVPDLLNTIGDNVIYEYITKRPDMMMKLGYSRNDAERATKRGEEYYDTSRGDIGRIIISGDMASEGVEYHEHENNVSKSSLALLKRMTRMLSFNEQKHVLTDIIRDYNARVEELDSQNRNPLKTREIEGSVVFKDKVGRVISGAPFTPDSDDPKLSQLFKQGFLTPLDEPVLKKTALIKSPEILINGEALEELYRNELDTMRRNGYGDNMAMADYVENNMTALLRPFMPLGATGIEEAKINGDSGFSNELAALNNMVKLLRIMTPGKRIEVVQDGDREVATVLSVREPKRPEQKGNPSNYMVRIAVAGDTKPRMLSLRTLMSQGATPQPGLDGSEKDVEALRNVYNNECFRALTDERILLTGNMFSAMKLVVNLGVGTLVSYQDDEGVSQKAVLVPKRSRLLDFLPIPVMNADIANEVLVNPYGGRPMNGGSAKTTLSFGDKDAAIRGELTCEITGAGNDSGTYSVKLPKNRGYSSRRLYGNGNVMKALSDYAARNGHESLASCIEANSRKNFIMISGMNKKESGLLTQGLFEEAIPVSAKYENRSEVDKLTRKYYDDNYSFDDKGEIHDLQEEKSRNGKPDMTLEDDDFEIN